MNKFNLKEIEFLNTLEEARIATSHNDIPHVKPVSFIKIDESIVIATDYNTRTYSNIKSNQNVGIVIDVYKSGEHKAICIQGKAEIIEKGEEFKKFYDIFYKKFQWVRKEPWKENEAPFLKIVPNTKISWGLD
ncbi:MAG: pyridoxamine 5'-phosphate oxidase family protein [Nitrosopumilus sp.]|nr:pyridoxamine 5'-phosphate oxidase family protein [Nitrosopumilus sp.]